MSHPLFPSDDLYTPTGYNSLVMIIITMIIIVGANRVSFILYLYRNMAFCADEITEEFAVTS